MTPNNGSDTTKSDILGARKGAKVARILALSSMVFTLCTGVFGAGYNWRRISELEPRVSKIEVSGSAAAQLSAKDIEWLKAQDEKILAEVREIRRILEAHIIRQK